MSGDPIRVGRTWLFPDGTTLPVISGGSDVAPAEAPDPGLDAPAEQPDAPEADTAVTEPDGEQDFHALAEEVGGLLAQEGDTIPVPRRVAERWNGEAQKYRERFQPYEKAFAEVPDADRDTMLTWLSDMTSDDPTARQNAAAWMKQVIDPHLPTPTAAEFEEGRGDSPDDPSAPADAEDPDKRVQRLIDERFKAEAEERRGREALAAFHAKGRELGYDPDPNAQDDARIAWQQVLLRAKERYYGDPEALEKAHRDLEAWRADNAKAYWQKKGADATLPTAPQDGTAPSGRTQPKTLEEAAQAARKRIDAALDGPG